MRWIALVATALVAAGSGFAAGSFWFSPRPGPVASSEVIAAAQRSSSWGLDPIWIRASGESARVRRIRDRAYAFCFRDGAIVRACADEQDAAVQGAALALRVAADWRRMPDKSRLGQRDRWVAENPDATAHVRAYCWSLYSYHGSQDARILGTCLGNLSLFTPFVQIPVD